MNANSLDIKPSEPLNHPLGDNTAGAFKDKDNALTPKVNPFRPDLPFSKKEQNKEAPVNRTTEW